MVGATLGFFLAVSAITSSHGQEGQGPQQRAVLFDQYNGQGNYIVISGQYAEDLSSAGWNDKTRSVCVTGVWMFYEEFSYNYGRPSGMEYVFGNNKCVNIRTLGGRISSLKFAGNPQNSLADSLTLFQGEYFQGSEEYFSGDQPTLNLVSHKSLIVNGPSSWTLFDLANFQGNHVCLRRADGADNGPLFLADIQNAYPESMPHGSIRSVKKGCAEQPQYTINLLSFNGDNGPNPFPPVFQV